MKPCIVETVENLSDEELVVLIQQRGEKDERPFQELFHRYQNQIWHVCYNFTHNRRDAEDLMQDIFLKVHRNVPKFEARSTFKTWVYRVALNTCYNEVRRRRRRPQEAETDFDMVVEWMSSTVSTEREVERRSRDGLLEAAFANLRPEESHILQMKDIEERPYTEIAHTLSISLSAAKMRAKRARHALKVAYTQLAGEEYAHPISQAA
ncbi:MAG: RNA polymerase sigma factor [Anaerolineales bacterium]|nr:RNA polymerase sigma factor [Anaerolineales bacterium]MCA9930965.1 RNA polymerase sigma factor [Anaerolineales bacterium]